MRHGRGLAVDAALLIDATPSAKAMDAALAMSQACRHSPP